jgi:hypothetical protein
MTRKPTPPLDQSAIALAKQLKPFHEGVAEFQSTIAQIAKQLQGLAANLGRIDWAAGLKKLEDSHTALAEAGWTLVDWIGLQDLTALSHKTPEELDEFFTEGFMTDDARNLHALRDELLGCSRLAQWHQLIDEIFASIDDGRHRIAIPATFTIIDGFLASFLVKHSIMSPRNSSPFRALANQGWDQAGYDAFFWRSCLIFLEKLFGHSPFTQDQPSFINRHWILHGRSAVDWTLADALRLVNALSALDFLFETVGLPKTA